MSIRFRKVKKAHKKMLRLSYDKFWDLYEVDDTIFVNKQLAIAHARQLAKVKKDYVTISKMKVPNWTPTKIVHSYGDKAYDGKPLPDVQVFIVEGVMHTTYDDARESATNHAKIKKDDVMIWATMVNMSDLVSIDLVAKPERLRRLKTEWVDDPEPEVTSTESETTAGAA